MARCIVCAEKLERILVDEGGYPLPVSAVEIFLRETSLEKRRISCRQCSKICFTNERERIPYSRKGLCSECGGNHMNGEIERLWLFRAKPRLICREHPL